MGFTQGAFSDKYDLPQKPQTLTMKIKGLYTNSNELSEAPDGSQSIADNIWISKDSIAESRRGFAFLPFALPHAADRADKLLQFQNTLLIHYNDTGTTNTNDTLAYYSNSTGVNNYTGVFAHPDPNLARTKFAESNQNLYFTTAAGVYKNDLVTNNPVLAGMYQGLDCQASLSVNLSGFLNNNSQVAYRVVWGITDANQNLILGAPSQRAIIANQGGTQSQISLQITIPAGITTSNIFQIYRSDQAAAFSTQATGTLQAIGLTAVTAGTNGNFIVVSYSTGGTAGSEVVTVSASTLTIGSLTYTSVLLGGPGTQITVAYTGGGTAGSEVVTVSGFAISVQIQSGVSTQNQIKAAINASSAALLLVTISGSSASTQTTAAAAPLTGGSVNVQIQSGVSTALQVWTALVLNPTALTVITPVLTGLSTATQVAAASVTLAGATTTLVTPDDNMQLVYQANPTGGQISALSVTVVDSTPDSLRGTALYTNATQQGILQSNNRPPYCLDMALFQTCMFFANTQTPQQLFLTILAVGASSGVQSGDTITIASVAYTAGSSENVGTNTFKVASAGSPAQNINDTALSLIRVINQSASTTGVYAFYLSGTSDLPGKMMIQARTLGTTAFVVTSSAHGSAYSPALPTSGTTVSSTNTVNLNGLMYSKAGQPESVPSLNILYVGSAAYAIRRIVPVRNSLFIFKDDGVFRCTGTAGNFAIDTIDTTVIILAPESAVALNNNCYLLSTQGVVAVNDNGAQVMSRSIENQLVQLEGASYTSLQTKTFGVSYESERQYCLWTITNSGDSSCTQCFIYNTFTKAWTRSTRNQNHGIVLKSDNKMYLANPVSNGISQERKNFNYTDYTDEAYAVTISAVGGGGATLTLADASNVVAGDLIYISLSISGVVASVNYATNVCTMETVIAGWVTGAASVLKAIPCTLQWLPITGGNPGYLRQYREAALIFKQNGFTNATIGFYSEISGSLTTVPFFGAAFGAWGTFAWGNGAPWGGVIESKAYRTYVPLEKQRCDLLYVQFKCINAWSTFQIEGLSTIYNSIGERMSN